MATSITTSLRLSDELRERYDTLARLTGHTRNGLMIDALERFIEQQMKEIVLVQEGIAQLDAGQGIAHDDVVARLINRGMLSAELLRHDRAVSVDA
jgi:predicted transcriptional regulator